MKAKAWRKHPLVVSIGVIAPLCLVAWALLDMYGFATQALLLKPTPSALVGVTPTPPPSALPTAVVAALTPLPTTTAPTDKIAFTSHRDRNWDIYVMNTDGSGQTNLTNHPAPDGFPAWSP